MIFTVSIGNRVNASFDRLSWYMGVIEYSWVYVMLSWKCGVLIGGVSLSFMPWVRA
jgi:hypothetical protein